MKTKTFFLLLITFALLLSSCGRKPSTLDQTSVENQSVDSSSSVENQVKEVDLNQEAKLPNANGVFGEQ